MMRNYDGMHEKLNHCYKKKGVLLATAFFVIGCASKDPVQNTDWKQQVNQRESNNTCGTLDDIALTVQTCSKPLMDILEGTIQKWPRNDQDIVGLCQSFASAERCIRETARRCTKGLQKVILSTLANSIQRSRKRECIKTNYPVLLKTTICAETHNGLLRAMVANETSRLKVIDEQIKDLDEKTTSVCCMVHQIEDDIKTTLNPKCPNETLVMMRLYRAVLQDVIDIICRAPKCDNLLKGYTVKYRKDFKGIVSLLLKIVFALG